MTHHNTNPDPLTSTVLDVDAQRDNVGTPPHDNEHTAKHWRGVIRTYDRDRIVVGNENFFQTKAATQQALPPNTDMIKSLETDSFIEYDLLHLGSGIIIGSVTLEEVKQ